MTKKQRILSIVGVAAIVAIGIAGWSAYRARQRADNLTLYGNVDIREVELAFRVGGRLASMRYEEGDQAKQGDQQLSQADRVLAYQKMQQDAQQFAAKHGLDLGESAAKIRNQDADSELKGAQAIKAKAEAGHTAVEASDTFKQAKDIVKSQGSTDPTDETPVH